MSKPKIIICHDAGDLSRRAAEQFVTLARAAIAARGRFSVALSGGSTPKALYSRLATGEFNAQLDWRRIHLFFGDERCVAPDHAESNFRMVAQSLLGKISIPADNVHRMAGELEPALAAADYAAQLARFFGVPEKTPPCFDLVYLGLGEDGHTASLFPGSAALAATEDWVVANFVGQFATHRLTLTFPVLNHAAQVSFLVSGAAKAQVLAAILKDPPEEFPAARVIPLNGAVIWFVDRAAAQQLLTGDNLQLT